VFLGITVLLMWEYRVTRASQQSLAGRVAHQNKETADLIMKAITRGMRGVQTSVPCALRGNRRGSVDSVATRKRRKRRLQQRAVDGS